MPVVFYDSLGEFMKSLPETPKHIRSDSFTAYQTYEEARANVYKGKTEILRQSDKMLEKLEADSIETSTLQWQHDRVGFIPCVPSYLAGAPMSMKRPIEVKTETAPMRVFASVCVSAGVEQEHLEKRGTAILALCRKLQASRSVELWLYADMYGRSSKATGACAIPVIRIPTTPLDLTTASYIMTDAGFLRQICFAWAYDGRGFQGSWAWSQDPRSEEASTRRRQVFSANDQDLIIPGGYLEDPLIQKPVEWVNEQVTKYTSLAEEDT